MIPKFLLFRRAWGSLAALGALLFTPTADAGDAKTKPEMEIVVQQGHNLFDDIVLSGDNRFALTFGPKETVMKMWDVESGTLVRNFPAYMRIVKAVLSPDGSKAVSVDDRHEVKVWDTATGERLSSFDPSDNYISWSYARVILSDNRRMVLNTEDRLGVEVRDIDTGKRLKRFEVGCEDGAGKKTYADVGDVTKDDRFVAALCTRDLAVHLFDLTTGERIWKTKRFEKHYTWESRLIFLPGEEKLVANIRTKGKKNKYGMVTTSGKDQVLVLDRRTGKTLKMIPQTGQVLRISPFGDDRRVYLVVKEEDDTLNLKVLDIATGKTSLFFIDGTTLRSPGVGFAGDGSIVLAQESRSGELRSYDVANREVRQVFRGNNYLRPISVATSMDNWQITSASSDGNLYIWDGFSAGLIRTLPTTNDVDRKAYQEPQYYFSKDAAYLLSYAPHEKIDYRLWNSDVRFWSSRYEDKLTQLAKYVEDYTIHSAAFSPDGKRIAILGSRGVEKNLVEIWDATTGSPIRTFGDERPGVLEYNINRDYAMRFSRDSRFLMVSASRVSLWDTDTGRLVHDFGFGGGGHEVDFDFTPDGEHVVIAKDHLSLFSTETGRRIRTYGGENGALRVAVSPDGQRIVSSNWYAGIDVWDLEKGALLDRLTGHTTLVHRIEFLPSNSHVVTTAADGTMKIWNLDSGAAATIVAFDKEWIVYTDDGYFDASRKGGRLIALVHGKKSYRVDQLAVRFNRPDVILSRLGLGADELIAHYRHLYEKRLRELGLEERGLSSAFEDAPIAKILNVSTNQKLAEVEIELSDAASELIRYNVYVNDVPLFGARGKETSGQHRRLTEQVALTAGNNKIEVSTINARGVESLRDFRQVAYRRPASGDLYYFGFGVSNYKDRQLNLKYAAKDVLDLEEVMKQSASAFDNVHTKVYTDAEVTPKSIEQAKQFLASAKVDDTVVLFVAGHGLYDSESNSDYYFVTSNTDLSNLEETAAHFDLIEDLLQGIAPRRKLFLLDTCQSGEYDSADEMLALEDAKRQGLAVRGIQNKALKKRRQKTSTRLVTNRERYIYNDLFRRSGAIVLSSSRGSEWSYESDAAENGIFTDEVLRALTSRVADRDSDGHISTEELRNHVMAAVEQKTGGLQHPVVDRDNLEMEFGFPIVRP